MSDLHPSLVLLPQQTKVRIIHKHDEENLLTTDNRQMSTAYQRHVARYVTLLLMVTSFSPSMATACEGCKMAAINGFKEPQTVQAGVALSWSVLFLLFVVFILLACLTLAIRSACREADAVHRARPSQ